MSLFKQQYPKVFVFALIITLVIGSWFIYNASKPSVNQIIPDINSTLGKQKRVFPEKDMVSQQKTGGQRPVQIASNDSKSSQIKTEGQRPVQIASNDSKSSELDSDNLRQLASSLIYGDVDDQVDAIKILSKIGSQEQIAVIESYAANPEKEIAIRLAAVENMDWEKNSETLISIIQGQNGEAEATIYMASSKELSEETRGILDEAIYSSFFKTTRPSTQLAILDYFLEQHNSLVDNLFAKLTLDQYSTEEKEDVALLLKRREEEP